jgi:hypothetical protein
MAQFEGTCIYSKWRLLPHLFPNEAQCAKNGVYDPIIWNIYLHCKSDLYVFLPLIPQKKILYDE